jgi:cytochrome c oxidase subunit 2
MSSRRPRTPGAGAARLLLLVGGGAAQALLASQSAAAPALDPDAGRASISSVLAPAATDAASIAQIGWVLFGGGTLIFLFVMALLWRALRGPGRPVRPMAWIVGGGLVFPVVVLSALLGWSTLRSAQFARATPADALVVSVTGRMWWWEIRYRDPASGAEIVTANELHLPLGRSVHLGLSTGDVIHSFWVPQLGGKVDMLPGRVNRLLITATAPGTYRGQCAEYCGEQHARMALHVVAQPAAEFEAWLAGQARAAQEPAEPLARRGREAFVEQRCAACHTVRGHTAPARLGPDLTHVGSRLHLGAGVLPNHPGTLMAWISNVQELKPGARMPSFGHVDPPTLQALAAYLGQLE